MRIVTSAIKKKKKKTRKQSLIDLIKGEMAFIWMECNRN